MTVAATSYTMVSYRDAVARDPAPASHPEPVDDPPEPCREPAAGRGFLRSHRLHPQRNDCRPARPRLRRPRTRRPGRRAWGIEGPPTLAVEVVSPPTEHIDRRRKLELYARHAIQHYWIVDPVTRIIEAYGLAGRAIVCPRVWRARHPLPWFRSQISRSIHPPSERDARQVLSPSVTAPRARRADGVILTL